VWVCGCRLYAWMRSNRRYAGDRRSRCLARQSLLQLITLAYGSEYYRELAMLDDVDGEKHGEIPDYECGVPIVGEGKQFDTSGGNAQAADREAYYL